MIQRRIIMSMAVVNQPHGGGPTTTFTANNNNNRPSKGTAAAGSDKATAARRWSVPMVDFASFQKPLEKHVLSIKQQLSPRPTTTTTGKGHSHKKQSSLAVMVMWLCLCVTYLAWTATTDLTNLVASHKVQHNVAWLLTSHPPLLKGVDVLPYNKIYRIPESHPQVGDRSDAYARLRQEYDALLPLDPARSLQAVQRLREGTSGRPGTNYTAKPMVSSTQYHQEAYDIHHCPDTPPRGYPFAWSLAQEVLPNWPPRDTSSHPGERSIYQGLCVFSYPGDLAKAQTYKDLELPFVVQDDPYVARTVERWNMPGYMDRMLSGSSSSSSSSSKPQVHRTEYSPNNHFLYKVPGSRAAPSTTPATDELQWLTFRDWLAKANVTDDLSDPNHEHWYYRLIGCGHAMGNRGTCDQTSSSSEYLFDELPFFQPSHQDDDGNDDNGNREGRGYVSTASETALPVTRSTHLFMGEDGKAQHGLHCRFGMRGVIAENHFDSSRNAIVLLGGSRRCAHFFHFVGYCSLLSFIICLVAKSI